MWTLFEPIHAVTYFTPEGRSAYEQAGLRGFWRGYFAGRAAPLGAAGPAVVAASFFNFAPAFVARAIVCTILSMPTIELANAPSFGIRPTSPSLSGGAQAQACAAPSPSKVSSGGGMLGAGSQRFLTSCWTFARPEMPYPADAPV